jgi:hypothetical protein
MIPSILFLSQERQISYLPRNINDDKKHVKEITFAVFLLPQSFFGVQLASLNSIRLDQLI